MTLPDGRAYLNHLSLFVYENSMEEQVISRAHRMGATRAVHVETLAMRGTIEEQMLEFLQYQLVTRSGNALVPGYDFELLGLNGAGSEKHFSGDADEYRNTLKQDVFKNDFEGARCHRTLHDFAGSNYLARLTFVSMSGHDHLGERLLPRKNPGLFAFISCKGNIFP
ncbi:hypothetical protein ACLOJK_000480 [Asimina triloba]